MAYLTEKEVRARAAGFDFGFGDFSVGLMLLNISQIFRSSFDIFLSHSMTDAELILGLKRLLEAAGKTVYVDWIDDREVDRSQVSAENAEMLRSRMRQCASLFYVHSRNSSTSRWMPWELGYFDGFNGNAAILPVLPDEGTLDFDGEEYLQLYPKVDMAELGATPRIYINRARRLEPAEFQTFDRWRSNSDKLRPSV